MAELIKANEPFTFVTRLHLLELTGQRASNLSQLLDCIKKMPNSSIYYHTHAFLQEYQYLAQDSPNDFAYWVSEVLGEIELGEQLSGIDTMQFAKIQDLQLAIAQTIENYLKSNELAKLRFARTNEEFHFIRSINFIIPTKFIAYDLKEFVDILKKVSKDSIYFHVFEARLRLEKPINDFSAWIRQSLNDKELADKISHLDPYTRTLEELRKAIIRMVERRISG